VAGLPANCGQNENGKRAPSEPLLLVHVLVTRQKNVEALSLDQFEKIAILNTAPMHASYGMSLMHWQGSRQLGRHIFVEEDLQRCA
jgi:hypothetical protein